MMPDFLSWLLIFPILIVIVCVHEFGHFITAKFFGMRVEEFGVGFPPRILAEYLSKTVSVLIKYFTLYSIAFNKISIENNKLDFTNSNSDCVFP